MKCPIDGTDLAMAERAGVEIDYCPTCRGVWLDRGELDKIIDRSAAEAADPPEARVYPAGGGAHDGQRKKKRGGLLAEIFDF